MADRSGRSPGTSPRARRRPHPGTRSARHARRPRARPRRPLRADRPRRVPTREPMQLRFRRRGSAPSGGARRRSNRPRRPAPRSSRAPRRALRASRTRAGRRSVATRERSARAARQGAGRSRLRPPSVCPPTARPGRRARTRRSPVTPMIDASTSATSVFLITTSMSYSRYRSTAMPIAPAARQ